MKSNKRSFFSEMRRIGRDLREVSSLADTPFSLEAIHSAVARAEMAFLEHLKGFLDFFREKLCFKSLNIDRLEVLFWHFSQ
jgi:hypothetical protein